MMKNLTILVPEGENNLSSIVGAYKIFARANAYFRERGKTEVFKVELAGSTTEVDFYGGLFAARPQKMLKEIDDTDLIIIPSLNHNYVKAVAQNSEAIEWIAVRYRQGASVASICTGAYLLAATGLLDGKSCATHWSVAHDFAKRFPKVDLKTDRLITDECGIYTNGGAYSFLNLILYLVEKYYDRDTSIFCAKVFQIELDRKDQSGFMIFSGQRSHGDELVMKVQELIETTIYEKLNIQELAAGFAVGRRNFDRRFIKATGDTPLAYAQRVKVEAAKKAFERTRKTVAEVMYEVGYADAKAFREVFRRITGLSPLDYRKRYNRDMD